MARRRLVVTAGAPNMKTLLTLLAAAGLVAGAASAAEKWTKPQQEVADVFKVWAEAELAGDVDREMGLFAPAFTMWDFSTPAPMDYAAHRQLVIDLFKQNKVTACVIQPDNIRIDGAVAVVHGRYSETVKDAAGVATEMGGPWSATLVRSNNKWLVLTLSYVDQPPAGNLPAPAAAENEITALEHAWAKAYVDRDIATLDRLEAAEWICTTADGEVVTKAGDIADVKSAAYQATVFRMEEVKVRVYGEMAVATALQTEQATYKGADASKVLRCTDTWVRRDGRWQCVATHLSPAAKK